MTLSVIVPTLNEADTLPRLVPALAAPWPGHTELLIVDGGSRDDTCAVARQLGATVLQTAPGRARQMNRGAAAARGDWLWFLHADSDLPPTWADQLCRATSDPRVIGGGFLVRIAAPGLRYRALDRWGWLRTRMQRTFYGDQGIFVRRRVFESLGGFAEWPIFEDVEFSERLRRAGRVVILPGPLGTSARRWERHGWWRTVAEHAGFSWRYHGARRRELPSYRPVAAGTLHVVVMAKAPIPGRVKTRLTPRFTPVQAAQLAQALCEDTVARVRQLPDVHVALAVDRAEAMLAAPRRFPGLEVIPQGDGDLGARLTTVIARQFARGASAVLVVGSDHPTMPRRELARAVRWLRRGGDRLVVGPAEDGGYYLIGVTAPHPELFRGIPWGGPEVFQRTVQQAAAARLPVRRVRPWYDVDTLGDVARLRRELASRPEAAPACFQWLTSCHV